MSETTKRRANATMDQKWLDGRLLTTVAGHPAIVFDPGKASATNRARAMAFGWQQRLADAGAVERTDREGVIRTDVEMNQLRYARIAALAAHYESGTEDWRLQPTREAGVDAGLTLMAIMRWRGIDVDAANALVDGLATKREITRAEALRAFAQAKQVAEAMAAIKAERASVDAEDLCAEIEAA